VHGLRVELLCHNVLVPRGAQLRYHWIGGLQKDRVGVRLGEGPGVAVEGDLLGCLGDVVDEWIGRHHAGRCEACNPVFFSLLGEGEGLT